MSGQRNIHIQPNCSHIFGAYSIGVVHTTRATELDTKCFIGNTKYLPSAHFVVFCIPEIAVHAQELMVYTKEVLCYNLNMS